MTQLSSPVWRFVIASAVGLSNFAMPANAENTLFSAPGGAVVQMSIDTCPEHTICVDADASRGATRLTLMLPEWVDKTVLDARSEERAAAAYIQGLSDGLVTDICNECRCCIISQAPSGDGPFVPWDAAPYALQQTPSLDFSK